MKIGILTYHRSHNYGALLQAIALRKVLSDMGHVVTFIDYWPAYHKHLYDVFSFHNLLKKRGIRGKCRYAKICFLHYKYRKRRKEAFDLFITNYIALRNSSFLVLKQQIQNIGHGLQEKQCAVDDDGSRPG